MTDGEIFEDAIEVVRIRFDWIEATDTFVLAGAGRELSGTPALSARARAVDALGSYRAELRDSVSGALIGADSVGTGQEFRRLTRALSFRLPVPASGAMLVLIGENPRSGVMEELYRRPFDLPPRGRGGMPADPPEVRLIKAATATPRLILTVYADGYTLARRERFWNDAGRVARALAQEPWPGIERLEIRAAFAPSNLTLGQAQDLGLPVRARDSHLGLYYPYWRNFGRWYHVVYPTSEEKYRAAIGRVPYDYPLALVDSGQYWGVGNYRELTAIPGGNQSFTYLLLHELGHFFGLNEEYEGGGATELAFAPETAEPWSQNITFTPAGAGMKWRGLVGATTPLPTPSGHWQGDGPVGAYAGGYADTPPFRHSHKPGYACTMESGGDFCPVCAAALLDRVHFDAGLPPTD